MHLQIIATHSCSHCSALERELRELGYDYEVLYVEEHPDAVKLHDIRHSPNLVVDGTVVCRGPIEEGKLLALIESATK